MRGFGTIGGLAICALLTACGSSGTAAKSSGTPKPVPYPAAMQRSFLSSCDQTSQGHNAYCRCALSKIEQAMPFKSFETNVLAVEHGSAKLAPGITNAETACRPLA